MAAGRITFYGFFSRNYAKHLTAGNSWEVVAYRTEFKSITERVASATTSCRHTTLLAIYQSIDARQVPPPLASSSITESPPWSALPLRIATYATD